MKRITNDKEYKDTCRRMNAIIGKGTELGNMELLPEEDKNEYIRLSAMVREWENVYYPFPIAVNPLASKIREKMEEQNLRQKEVAKMIGVNEARISEIMRGKRRINISIAKKLNTELHIPAEEILEYA